MNLKHISATKYACLYLHYDIDYKTESSSINLWNILYIQLMGFTYLIDDVYHPFFKNIHIDDFRKTLGEHNVLEL